MDRKICSIPFIYLHGNGFSERERYEHVGNAVSQPIQL